MMKPSKWARMVIGLTVGGRIRGASGKRAIPRPGPVGMVRKPLAGSGTLSTMSLPRCLLVDSNTPASNSVAYSWMAKFGMAALSCKHAASPIGESGL